MHKGPVPVPQRAQKKPHLWVRILMMALSILLVLLLAGWLLFPRIINPDRLIRTFRYMGLRDQADFGRIIFEGSAENVFAGRDEGLVVGSENGLTLFDLRGTQKAFVQEAFSTPVLRTGEDAVLCFCPGSTNFAMVTDSGEIVLEESIGTPIVNADLSTDGYLAYITTESGYKSVTTVRNSAQKPIFRFSSRTRYLNACAVSEGGRLLAVSSLEEHDSIYRTSILFLHTDETLADLETDTGSTTHYWIDNEVVYELRFLRPDRLMAICQNEILFLDTEGNRLASVSLADRTLADYSVSADGWLILAFEPQSGGYRLMTLNANGEKLAETEIANRIRSVSACEGYAAVLTELSVETFDRKLRAYDRSWEIQGVNRVLARADGSVLLVSAGSTKLFIP